MRQPQPTKSTVLPYSQVSDATKRIAVGVLTCTSNKTGDVC
jgi:hypothetical protein